MAPRETDELLEEDDAIAIAVDDYLSLRARGDCPPLEDFVAKYPKIATVLKSVIPALAMADDSNSSSTSRPSEGHPEQLGDFRIRRQLGRGGMGIVYEAEQLSMNRTVALKVLPLAGLVDESKLRRFQNEIRAAAALDHPNIVSIYSVGEQRGVHYFAMQLVRGRNLAQIIASLAQLHGHGTRLDGESVSQIARGESLSDISAVKSANVGPNSAVNAQDTAVNTRAAAEDTTLSQASRKSFFRSVAALGVQAAMALQHAHEHGIVHRDIKPANLLLDKQSQLYLADFGLARLEADAGLTMTGDLLGTLRYMAPELTLEQSETSSPRSDIYSLGVTLYELVVLRPAFAGDNRHQLLKQIALAEPRALRRVDPSVPADLATIIQKAIAKEPLDRYATARELAEDLERFLDHRPVLATRPTLVKRTTKWARRHMALTFIALMSLLVITLVLGATTLVVFSERNSALATAEELRQALYASEMNDAFQSFGQANVRRAEMLLAQQIPEDDERDLRGIEWYFLASGCQATRGIRLATDVRQASLSPDQMKLAALIDGELLEIDLVSRQRTVVFGRDQRLLGWSVYSPDGKCLAIAAEKGILVMRMDTGMTFRVDHEGADYAIAFSPDGKLGACASEDGVRVWDADTGAIVSTLPDDRNGSARLSFSVDSQQLATASELDKTLQIWNLADGKCVAAAETLPNSRVIQFLENDAVLLAGREGIQVVPVPGSDAQRWRDLALPPTREIFSAALGEANTRLAIGTEKNEIEVWDLINGTLKFKSAKSHRVQHLEFLRNESQLLVVSDGVAELISSGRQSATDKPPVEIRFEWCDCMSVWRDEVAVAGPNQNIVIWNLTDGSHRILDGIPPVDEPLVVTFVAHSPDGTRVAATPRDTAGIWIWDTATGQLVEKYVTSEPVYGLAYAPDGDHLAAGTPQGLMLWDTRRAKTSWRQRVQDGVVSLRYSPDGKSLFAGGGPWYEGGKLWIWNLSGEQPRLAAQFDHREIVLSIAVSHDGRWVAAGDNAGRICIYDVQSLTRKTELVAHSMPVGSLAFAPDGGTLVSSGYDGHVKFWHVDSWKQVADWPGSDLVAAVRFVTTSPDNIGLIIGTRIGEDAPAKARLVWMDTRPDADWSWLGK